MSNHELRTLAETYVDKQLKLASATVTAERRGELVEGAIRIIDPKRDDSQDL